MIPVQPRKHIIILLAWATVQVLLLIKNGIVVSGEAVTYIGEAETILLTGKANSVNFWQYSVQSFLIVLDRMLKANFLFAVVAQFFFSLLATFSFFRLVSYLFSPSIGFLCTIILLLNYPFHEFNTFLQTESLYSSFILIFSSYLLRRRVFDFFSIIIVLAFLLLLALTRPTGILFILPTALYILFHFRNKISSFYLLVIGSLIFSFFLLVLDLSMSRGGRFNFMIPFKMGYGVCSISVLPAPAAIKIVDNSNSLYGLFYYITHNASHFTYLAIKKFFVFLGLARHYFSPAHNIFLLIYFYPMYLMSALSIRSWIKDGPQHLLYLGSALLMVLGSVILTCDDWHNRFFLPTSPFLIILSVPAIKKLFPRVEPGQNKV